jgi:flagellar basal-body rod modification protein FlgD
MTVSAIGTTTSQNSTASLSSANSLNQQDFINILLTQLTYQDPLKPMDNEQFMAQMAQFTTLEQTQKLNDSVNTLLSVQGATQSIGLIGKTVEVNASGSTSIGTVTTISFSNGAATLTIKPATGQDITGIDPTQVTLVR